VKFGGEKMTFFWHSWGLAEFRIRWTSPANQARSDRRLPGPTQGRDRTKIAYVAARRRAVQPSGPRFFSDNGRRQDGRPTGQGPSESREERLAEMREEEERLAVEG